jgi:hypothetical protein
VRFEDSATTVACGAAAKQLAVTASDADNDALSYSWSLDGVALAGSSPTIGPFGTDNLLPGSHIVRVNAIDNYGGQGSGSFTFTVSSCNDPPTASAAVEGLPCRDGAPTDCAAPVRATCTITLDGSGSRDSDGSIATYRWFAKPSSSGAEVALGAASAQPTLSAAVGAGGLSAGEYIFRLQVTDDKGAVADGSLTYQLERCNRVPVLTDVCGGTPIVTAAADCPLPNPITFGAPCASDADDDSLALTWEIFRASELSAANAQPVLTRGPAPRTSGFSIATAVSGVNSLPAGSYVVRVTVNESAITGTTPLSTSLELPLEVNTCNTPPAGTVAVDVMGCTAVFMDARNFSDADNDILNFYWNITGGSLTAPLLSTGTGDAGAVRKYVPYGPGANLTAAGTYLLTLIVSTCSNAACRSRALDVSQCLCCLSCSNKNLSAHTGG